jgi:hypothetical protein
MVTWAADNWFQILVVLFLFRHMRALHALGRAGGLTPESRRLLA